MILKIVCAWCGKELGEKEYFNQPEMARNITHSMCAECLEKEIAGMMALMSEKAEQKARSLKTSAKRNTTHDIFVG